MPGWSFLPWVLLLMGTVQSTSERPYVPQDPLRGRIVFEQKGCVSCHAVGGSGGAVAVDLGRKRFYGSRMDLASTMWNHAPEMLLRMRELGLPYPEFSNREMVELAAYLYFQRYLGEPGDLYRGKILVREKGCLSCHSVGDQGAGTAPAFDELAAYVAPLYMAQALWNHGPSMHLELSKRGLESPQFAKGEIVDLGAYIRAASRATKRQSVYMAPGSPKRGAEVLNRKGCLTCHSIRGKGGTEASDFADLEWNLSVTEIAGLMWNHSVEMNQSMAARQMSWPEFSGGEMADLIAYLYFLGFESQSGDPSRGANLFLDKQCSLCHQAAGQGGQIGPEPEAMKRVRSSEDMAALMWNHAPTMEKKVVEKLVVWPSLSGKDMADLYAFIRQTSRQ